MITLEAALATAREFVSANRTMCSVSGLLEDDEDYLVVLDLLPEFSEPVIGEAPILISKADGEVHEEAFGDAFFKMLKMTPAR